MTEIKKRDYRSKARENQAAETKVRILSSAQKLFQTDGFESVTIEKIAKGAGVAIPTVYALFQSKRGILLAIIDQALPSDEFNTLVEQSIEEKSPKRRLAISASIARKMYDAEKVQMNLFRGATLLAPEFLELEKEREMRRHARQEVTIEAMVKANSLPPHLTPMKARDILWAFTGRDLYRMLVIERGWSSDAYEEWLTQLLVDHLVAHKDT